MDKNPHGCTYVTKEAKESRSQEKANPQDSSDFPVGTLSDSERTLTDSFGEIQEIDHGGESEVDSVVVLSQGKGERLIDTSATTHASSIRSIQKSDLGDESKVVSIEIVAIGKQEVHSNDKEIDVRAINPAKIIPEHEESVITKNLKENSSNIQSGKKVKKRFQEDNGGHKTQKSGNPNLQGNGTSESKRGKTNGQVHLSFSKALENSRTLSDSERTLTDSFGEIQEINHGGESEVDSAVVLSQGKGETLVDTSATTHATSIRSIQKSDLGDEPKVVSTEIVAIGKQEVHSNGKDIDVREITPSKIIPGHEESAITKILEENSSNIQSGKKVKKRAREDNGGHRTQKSRNPNLQGNGTGESKRGRTNGQDQSRFIRGRRVPTSNNLPHGFV